MSDGLFTRCLSPRLFNKSLERRVTGFCHIYYCSLAIRGERDLGVGRGRGVLGRRCRRGGGSRSLEGGDKHPRCMHTTTSTYGYLRQKVTLNPKVSSITLFRISNLASIRHPDRPFLSVSLSFLLSITEVMSYGRLVFYLVRLVLQFFLSCPLSC